MPEHQATLCPDCDTPLTANNYCSACEEEKSDPKVPGADQPQDGAREESGPVERVRELGQRAMAFVRRARSRD